MSKAEITAHLKKLVRARLRQMEEEALERRRK
jgi:hypothetical protein